MYSSRPPQWLNVYSLVVVVVMPSFLMLVFNALILLTVRSFTRRVHATVNTAVVFPASNFRRLNARDVSLLKHMAFLLVVFMIGWAPIYIVLLGDVSLSTPPWIVALVYALPVMSAVIQVIDLFMYNRDLRQYIREQWQRRTRINVY